MNFFRLFMSGVTVALLAALLAVGNYASTKVQEVIKLKQDIDRLQNLIHGLRDTFGDDQSEPEPEIVVVKETEYLLPPQEEKVVTATEVPPALKTINPNKIPITKNWVLHGGETVARLTEHLTDPAEPHKVEARLIQGWNLDQLKRLHSYLHNGFPIEALYE